MRHAKHKGRLGRPGAHRQALMRNLAMALIENGRIRTTDAKAKYLRPFVERLVTLSRDGSTSHRRLAFAMIPQKETIKKLFDEIGPRFAERPGGYTRIIKEGVRPGDGSPMSFIEWVDFAPEPPRKKATEREKRMRRIRQRR